MEGCPICGSPIQPPKQSHDWAGYYCPRCGPWSIDCDARSTEAVLLRNIGAWDGPSLRRRTKLSYILQHRQSRRVGGWAPLLLTDLSGVFLDEERLSPSEQLDELILMVGEAQPSAGSSANIEVPRICAWVGAAVSRDNSTADLSWLLDQDETKAVITNREGVPHNLLLRLTLAGWKRFDELKKGRIESRRVLMAMKFDDPELDRVVATCFVPAVRRAGFELRSLRDGQPSGVIDDQMRVALRNSRFVIADLTHSNQGAYWEAGFAEGLGRPVIYTCRRQKWEIERTHFDTNHLVTIVWDPANPEPAGKQLTATIRATLPAEATMESDDQAF